MLSFCVSEYCNSVCECCHSVIFRRPCWQLYLTRDDFKDLEILIFFRFRRLLVGFHDVMWELSGHRCGHHQGTDVGIIGAPTPPNKSLRIVFCCLAANALSGTMGTLGQCGHLLTMKKFCECVWCPCVTCTWQQWSCEMHMLPWTVESHVNILIVSLQLLKNWLLWVPVNRSKIKNSKHQSFTSSCFKQS